MQEEPSEFAAFVGIDWADRNTTSVSRLPGTDAIEASVVEHRPKAIEEWAHKFRERFAGQRIAVCLELSHGPIVSALLEHDIFVIYPVNPSTLAKYRRAFTPSRAKDDPTDAAIALELLRRHREKLKPLRNESPNMRALRRLVESRRDLVQDRVRITNRLTFTLKAYFPQVLDWFRDKETDVFACVPRTLALLARRSARPARDHRRFLSRPQRPLRFGHRSPGRSNQVRATADFRRCRHRTSTPSSRSTSAPTPGGIRRVPRLDDEIARRCQQLPDYFLFADLPGAGRVFSARLLAAFGEQRDRFTDASAFQKYAGIAPVTERSGNKHWVHWRWACPTFLRQTFVEWVASSVPHSFWARAFYDSHRAKGASHNATFVPSPSNGSVLFRCW